MATSTMEPITVDAQLLAIRAENKQVRGTPAFRVPSLAHARTAQIIRLLRKIKAKQDDPDGVKAAERAAKNGFKKPLDVSEALRSFLGLSEGEQISRSEVTKRISAYISENKLKHPGEGKGRVIVPDDKLKALLGAPDDTEITILNMQKFLSPHYIKPAVQEAAAKPSSEEKPAKKAKVAAPAAAEAPTATSSDAAPKRPVVKRKAT